MKPDGVWSFVDNHQHVAITKDCAERGISVMFEKPMATTHADAIAIRDIAKAGGIQVVINSQPPWWPANHTASQLARSGELGAVWRVHTVSGHGGPGGGPWRQLGKRPSGAGSRCGGPARVWCAAASRPYRRQPGVLVDAQQRRAGRRRAARFRPVRRRVGAVVPRHADDGLRHPHADAARRLPGADDHRHRGLVSRSSHRPDRSVVGPAAQHRAARGVRRPRQRQSRVQLGQSADSLRDLAGREKREVPLAVTSSRTGPTRPRTSRYAVRRGEVDEFVRAAFHADVMAILEAAQRSADSGQPVSVASVTGR